MSRINGILLNLKYYVSIQEYITKMYLQFNMRLVFLFFFLYANSYDTDSLEKGIAHFID